MGNHFHLLLSVPTERSSLSAMSDEELIQRCSHIYGKVDLLAIEEELDRLRGSALSSDQDQRERLRERFFARMHDLAAFVGEVKQRFSQWHNRRCGRTGTLWEGRYKSVLVEGSDHALRTMAAYIDLNPVRARLVSDPADYRWSGYGEAVAGVKQSREALCELVENLGWSSESTGTTALSVRWRKAQGVYRRLLYVAGRKRAEGPAKGKHGFTDAEIEAVEDREGRLGIPEMLRHRVRYFHDGVAIGSRAFLEEVFRNHRENFGPKRKEGARRMRGADWGELMAMRDVRVSE
jgi:hypothetical protein